MDQACEGDLDGCFKFKMSVQRSSKNVSEHLDIQICYLLKGEL